MTEYQENITLIESEQHFDDMMKGTSLIVADFFAPWCGPCQRILQLLPSLATANPDVQFIKINVDEQEILANKYNAQSIPHICFFKGGESKALVVGANLPEIKDNIEKLH